MSYKRPRPYNNGPKRPLMTPPGTAPQPERRSTRDKTVIEGHRKMHRADMRRIRKYGHLHSTHIPLEDFDF